MAATVPDLKPAYHFAQYNKHSKELQELMKAQKFPTIIVIKVIETGDFRFVEYTGNLDDFSLLRVFLQNLRNVELIDSPKPVLSMDLSRVEELYSKTYQSLCFKKGGICAMALFNGSAYDSANAEAFETLKTLQKDLADNTDYHFGWVDGLCESELRSRFELSEDSLPTLILYVPTREKAAKFVGKFDLDSLKEFLKNSAAGKVKTFRVEGIQFTDRNCDALGSEQKRKPRHTEL